MTRWPFKEPCMDDVYYILEGTEPVRCHDALTWAQWFETANRQVADTWMTPTLLVSTIFLGLNHQFFEDAPPLLFETMVFRNGHGDEQERYTTWHEAEQGHEHM